jgi:hypothetical protein
MRGFQILAEAASAVDAGQVARCLTALIFMLAGRHKLVATASVAETIVRFGFGRRAMPWLAVLLGAAEIAVGVGLVVDRIWLVASVAAVLLSAAFGLIVVSAVRRGGAFACNCFRSEGDDIGWPTVVRSAGIFGCAALSLVAAIGTPTFMGQTERVLNFGIALSLLCAGLVAAAAHSAWREGGALERALDWRWILQQNEASRW